MCGAVAVVLWQWWHCDRCPLGLPRFATTSGQTRRQRGHKQRHSARLVDTCWSAGPCLGLSQLPRPPSGMDINSLIRVASVDTMQLLGNRAEAVAEFRSAYALVRAATGVPEVPEAVVALRNLNKALKQVGSGTAALGHWGRC